MEYKLPFVSWREGLRSGKLLGLKCNDCGEVTCPPRKVCAGCASENMDVIELEKKGEIKTYTVCYAVPTGFVGPYVVAMAELKPGCRVMGNVLGIDPTKVGMDLIGKKVDIGFQEIPGDYLTGGDTRIALTFQLGN
jgi:uncharacterized OB-fold protein